VIAQIRFIRLRAYRAASHHLKRNHLGSLMFELPNFEAVGSL
jgi:hypothetical protein